MSTYLMTKFEMKPILLCYNVTHCDVSVPECQPNFVHLTVQWAAKVWRAAAEKCVSSNFSGHRHDIAFLVAVPDSSCFLVLVIII
jgi:hypothetical protein